MGINIGALAGPLICGYLGEEINWHLGFGAAGVGMLLGVVQYVWGWRRLGAAGVLRAQEAGDRAGALRALAGGSAALAALAVVLAALHLAGVLDLVHGRRRAQAASVLITVLVILYFAYVFLLGGLDPEERRRVAVIPVLLVAAAVFWAGFEQAGSSMNLFAERLTDRNVLGWEAPASWLQSVNPLFIVLLAPLFGSLWLALGARNPSIPVKFALGLAQLGAGFLVLAWGKHVRPPRAAASVDCGWS